MIAQIGSSRKTEVWQFSPSAESMIMKKSPDISIIFWNSVLIDWDTLRKFLQISGRFSVVIILTSTLNCYTMLLEPSNLRNRNVNSDDELNATMNKS